MIRNISMGYFALGLRSHITKAGWLCFFKIDKIHYSMLDVQCSMFDVHFFSAPATIIREIAVKNRSHNQDRLM